MIEKIFQKNEEIINVFYLFNKILIIAVSSYFAFYIRIKDEKFYDYLVVTSILILIYLILEVLIFKKNRFYQKKISLVFYQDINHFFISILILIFLGVILKVTGFYSRFWLISLIILSSLLLLIHKYFFNYLYNKLIQTNLLTKNVFLIGNFDDCKRLLKEFRKENKFHFRLCNFIDKHKSNNLFPIQQIELDKKLSHNLTYYNISQVWILAAENINRKILMNKLSHIPIDIRTLYSNEYHRDILLDNLNGYSIFDTSLSPFYGFNYILKFLFDYSLGFIFFIISFPIILFFGTLILIEDGKPFLFIQKRHGWDGRVVNIYKLRSLKKTQNNSQVSENDKRVLKVGRFIRRFSIDELPQFFNVLKGDMSIVGPRPHAVEHNDEFSKQVKGFMLRHKCKPGLTGLAQMKGYRGNITDKKQLTQRYEQDMLYIKKWSIFLDVYIVLQTAIKVFIQKAH